MNSQDKPIAVFDSGVGGISVLKELVRILPRENYIYYGDSRNAPYGSRPLEEIQRLTMDAMEFLMDKDIKAIVVACNTATSAAIDLIREKYKDFPIFGIEPALKPAVSATDKGSIVVMATERTLREKKFARLMNNVAREREVIKLPCPGLADLIEAGKADSAETRQYLRDKFSGIDLDNVSAVVLGCTHYPFIRHPLAEIIGKEKLIMDGSNGIARHLKNTLEQRNLLTDRTEPGEILLINSNGDDKMLHLSRDLLISGCTGPKPCPEGSHRA